MPRRPLCSTTLKTSSPSSDAEPLSRALTYPWISFNTPAYVNAITIDCDHDDLDRVRYLEQFGIGPTFVTISPESGRFHATWFLRTPVHRGHGARPKPQKLLRWAIELLTTALGGDQAYGNGLTKNPWGVLGDATVSRRFQHAPANAGMIWEAHDASGTWLRWHTIEGNPELVELRHLVDALEPEYGQDTNCRRRARRVVRSSVSDVISVGRNDDLFNRLRCWAMQGDVRDGGAILAKAGSINREFASPLSSKEVAGVAKSVAGWMNTRWRGHRNSPEGRQKRVRQGRMRLETLSLPVAEKRALAGKYAGRMNRTNSDRRLVEAIAALQQEGTKMTQAAVAARANLCVRTVRSRWTLLMGEHLRDSVDIVAASPRATPGTFRCGSLAEFHVPQLAEAPD